MLVRSAGAAHPGGIREIRKEQRAKGRKVESRGLALACDALVPPQSPARFSREGLPFRKRESVVVRLGFGLRRGCEINSSRCGIRRSKWACGTPGEGIRCHGIALPRNFASVRSSVASASSPSLRNVLRHQGGLVRGLTCGLRKRKERLAIGGGVKRKASFGYGRRGERRGGVPARDLVKAFYGLLPLTSAASRDHRGHCRVLAETRQSCPCRTAFQPRRARRDVVAPDASGYVSTFCDDEVLASSATSGPRRTGPFLHAPWCGRTWAE